MSLSRRDFLRTATVATAALEFPLIVFAGEPSRAATPGGSILLNSNENAYGPLPSVAAMMPTALAQANRYPFGQYDSLVDRIAAENKVSPHQVLTGCGSTEILRIAASAFLDHGNKQLITASPTFEAIGWYARSLGVQAIEVPVASNYAHDLDAMLRKTSANTGLIYICNPNNPTASLTPRRDLEAFIARLPQSTYVLVDEAYHHFAVGAPDYVSFLEKPLDDPRIIVARTFSKVYGLAGMRLGYSVAAPATTQKMRPFQQQDNVNMVVALAGVASLNDSGAMHAAVARNSRDRDEFMRQAAARGLKPIPSYCNFLMMDSGRPVQQVIDHFKKNGILIGRRFPAMATFVRISLGRPAQMQSFWRVWDKLPKAT